jgi:hypothetical protein
MEKLARRIKNSLNTRTRVGYASNTAWINRYGNFNTNNSVETIKRKLQLVKKMKPSEKTLLWRLYEPYFSNVHPEKRNNNKIKPTRNWYIGVLAKKYNVPRNWLNENPGLNPGPKYPLHKKFILEHYPTESQKRAVRRISKARVGQLERRSNVAKKALSPLRGTPFYETILRQSLGGTRRFNQVSPVRLFN